MRSSGAASDLSALKDGDGDGTVGDADDQDLVTMNNGRGLVFDARSDGYDDEIINNLEYMAWRAGFGGSGSNVVGDWNNDGVVDTADYVVWRKNENTYSAWNTGALPGGGSGGAIVQIGIAPRVTNVVVSGSQSLHAPYSFNTVDGSGEQLRTVPVGGADSISIAFSEDVNIQSDHLTFVGLRTANRPAVAEFTYDIATMTATWRFDDLIANDHYAIRLSDAVTDIEGDRLDGEWVNPASVTTTNAEVSEFPSGDGEAGGNFNFVMTLLSGDADRNNYEAPEDYEVVWQHWGMNGSGVAWIHGDVNGDQVVDGEDVDIVDQYQAVGIYIYLDITRVLADLNGDWKVDEADLDIIYGNDFLANPTYSDGDLDGDGDIDLDDVDLAFSQLGLQLALAS